MHFPIREALPASGQENPNCVVRGCDPGADLKEPRHEIHRLNIRHCTQNGTPEAFSPGGRGS